MKYSLILFFVFSLGIVFGQNKNQKNTPTTNLKSNDLDQQYTPVKNSLFDEDAQKNNTNSIALADFKNVVRFNPFLLARSVAAIGYERSLNDYLGIEAYLGYNYKLDWMQAMGAVINDGEVFGTNSSSITFSEMLLDGKFNSGGIFGSLGLKIYFDGTPFEGNYIGIQTRYNSYTLNLSNSNFNYNFSSVSEATTTIKNSSLLFLWGTSVVGGTKIPVVHDFYTGIGIRKSSYDIYTYDQNANESVYSKTGNRENGIGLSYVVGYSFGFGLKRKKSL
jgi:hypothetical protein